MLAGDSFADLTIGFTPGFGTAITQLKYNGVNLLDNSDHGRSLQSAVSFDGLGECYNPTEAGSWRNAKVEKSSKVVFRKSMLSYEWMGWWYNPGDWCINEKMTPTYKSITSDYGLAKQYHVDGNILTVNTTYYVPRDHKSATFEALTGYFPRKHFSMIGFFDPVTQETLPYFQDGEQKSPVIIYNRLGDLAVGIYSPDLPYFVGHDLVGYGAFTYPDWFYRHALFKFNCVFRANGVAAFSAHSFTCQVVTGTLDEVKKIITRLHDENLLRRNGVIKS